MLIKSTHMLVLELAATFAANFTAVATDAAVDGVEVEEQPVEERAGAAVTAAATFNVRKSLR